MVGRVEGPETVECRAAGGPPARTVEWFDDWMHLMNTGPLAGAIFALTTASRHTPADVVLRAVGIGATLALGWEVFEYVSFVTRSPELPTAYADTVVDLCLGWLGSAVAGVVVATRALRRRRWDLGSQSSLILGPAGGGASGP